jgi:hypothetical protein
MEPVHDGMYLQFSQGRACVQRIIGQMFTAYEKREAETRVRLHRQLEFARDDNSALVSLGLSVALSGKSVWLRGEALQHARARMYGLLLWGRMQNAAMRAMRDGLTYENVRVYLDLSEFSHLSLPQEL